MRTKCPVCKEDMKTEFPDYAPLFMKEYYSFCPNCKTVFYEG